MVHFKSRKKVGQDRPKVGPESQILALEKEIRETPYNKSTERHIGLLRARIAKLKDLALENISKKSGSAVGYAVKKQGDATIVLVGPPSAGKSTLINKLTNADSKVAPYAFTTVSVIPGMMNYKGAHIQVLDVPGLIEGAEEGKGRGREVLSVIRGANLLVIMADPKRIHSIEKMLIALERNGIRVNKTPPKIRLDKKPTGSLIVHSNIKQELTNETIKDIASSYGIKSGDIYLEQKVSLDELIDSFSKNRVYVPAIFVINKADTIKKYSETGFSNQLLISAQTGMGLEELKSEIWKKLNFVVVYLVRDDEEPSARNPLISTMNKTLKDIALEIGSDFSDTKTGARIWGNGAKFAGQEVSLLTKVVDGMMVRFF